MLNFSAHGHTIKLRDWGWTPSGEHDGYENRRTTLSLDGFCLAVCGAEHEQLLRSIADKLAYALRVPERKKRPRARKPKPV